MPLFRGKKRKSMLAAGLLLFPLLLTACGGNASVLDAAGPIADRERTLFWIILGIATVIFIGVEGMLVYSIVKFRERPGMPNPRQLHGNLAVEAAWTAAPALVLFIILGFTIQTLFSVSTQPAGQTIQVRAVGHQWWWEFYYPEYNITTADSLYIPTGKTIQVSLFTNNVIHSFWVPQLTGKTDLIPGHDNQKWFQSDKDGTYVGECAEYCGDQHAHMNFNVVSQNYNTFMSWVTTQKQDAVVPTSGSDAEQGAKIFVQQCSTCHGIKGTGQGYVTGYYDPEKSCNTFGAGANNAVECKVGPNLTHFGSRDLIAGGVLTNNKDQCSPGPDLLQRCNLAKWLNNPQGIKPGNDMQIGQLSPTQINQLVAYLESLT